MVNKIKVYSTPNCPNCKILKIILKEMRLPFEEIELTDTMITDLIMDDVYVRSAPAIDIGGMVFIIAGKRS